MVLPTAMRRVRACVDMSAKNVIRLAIFDLGEEVLVATEVPDAAVSWRKMCEYDPRDLMLGTKPCAFVPESFAALAYVRRRV